MTKTKKRGVLDRLKPVGPLQTRAHFVEPPEHCCGSMLLMVNERAGAGKRIVPIIVADCDVAACVKVLACMEGKDVPMDALKALEPLLGGIARGWLAQH